MITVDARGLACPQPVISTKQALDGISEGAVKTIVDNRIARDNVVKFARNAAYSVSIEEKGSDFHITIGKNVLAGIDEALLDTEDTILLFTGEGLGRGDENLGRLLAKNFFYALNESSPLPKEIVFLNGGVKLAVEGSEALGHLRQLADRGVKISACGICLDYFGLKDKLAVGQVTNMYSIVEAVCQARKVITF